MVQGLVDVLKGFNDLLTAGIAITAFSLLLYALSFNLRDRVARSFAIILLCVVLVSVGDAIASNTYSTSQLEFWMRVQWIGIIFLPPAYLHFSDALLETTGRPSRGRRRRLVWVMYVVSMGFVILLPTNWLVGPVVEYVAPAPFLQRTSLTWFFAFYYLSVITISGINLWRAYKRTVTRTSRRRMANLGFLSLLVIRFQPGRKPRANFLDCGDLQQPAGFSSARLNGICGSILWSILAG